MDEETLTIEQAVEQAAGQTPQAEAPAEAPKEPPKEAPKEPDQEEVKAHERFIAAAKREKALREKERALKAQEAEVLSLKSAREKVKADPLAALEELGLTYEQITNLILERDAPAKEPSPAELAAKIAREEIEKYKAERAKVEQEEQSRITERQIASVKQQIADIAASGGEKYELVSALGATERVWEHAAEVFEKTGKVLPLEEAIAAVEAQIEAEITQNVLGLKKVAKLMAPKPVVKSSEPRVSAPTLTNRSASESGALQEESYESEDALIEKISKQIVWK
jgi:antitoxin component of RelBE/YafQ-DinJ toxin-antitoxin module